VKPGKGRFDRGIPFHQPLPSKLSGRSHASSTCLCSPPHGTPWRLSWVPGFVALGAPLAGSESTPPQDDGESTPPWPEVAGVGTALRRKWGLVGCGGMFLP
jgi:hypothetical protein